MSQKILKFKATSGFGKWKRYFPESAVSHPAKINLNLLEYLILNYTKEGDTVLDCMCGTGSTVVLSMLKNRNAIGIDLEEKFTNWAKQAIKNVEQQQTLMPKGKGLVVCGDSRKLSKLLKMHKEEISSVIFLPPYSTAGAKGDENPENYIRRANDRYDLMKQQGINRPDTEPGRYSGSWENIGNLPFGVDEVVTSPPYEQQLNQIGERETILMGAIERWRKKDPNHPRLKTLEKQVERNGGDIAAFQTGYTKDKNNIGNQKKETYLEAMKLVYEQCFLVLKPQGLLILILKNFIRDKKVVKLTDHTIRLCVGVGFKLKERLLFRLPTQSFWRRLYSQKYPEVDTSDLRYEHILIFEKKEQSGKNK